LAITSFIRREHVLLDPFATFAVQAKVKKKLGLAVKKYLLKISDKFPNFIFFEFM